MSRFYDFEILGLFQVYFRVRAQWVERKQKNWEVDIEEGVVEDG